MSLRLGSLLVLVEALAFVSSASGAYPGPLAVQGGTGLAGLDGSLHFVADKAGSGTRISAVATDGGAVMMSRTLSGSFGTIAVTPNGEMGGLFQDGSAFVLQNLGINSTSSFLIVGA